MIRAALSPFQVNYTSQFSDRRRDRNRIAVSGETDVAAYFDPIGG